MAGCAQPFSPVTKINSQPEVKKADVTIVEGNRRFFITAKANGQPFRFQVDTGANLVAFPWAAAASLGTKVLIQTLVVPKSVATAGDFGHYQAMTFKLDSLEIGNCKLRDVDAGLVNAGQFQPLLGVSALEKMGEVKIRNGIMTMDCPVPERPAASTSTTFAVRDYP